MKNTPANTDYLFISTQKCLLTKNTDIKAQVRVANTYQNYDMYNKPDGFYINESIGRYYNAVGFDFKTIAETINRLAIDSGLPVRFSNSMLVHENELEKHLLSQIGYNAE